MADKRRVSDMTGVREGLQLRHPPKNEQTTSATQLTTMGPYSFGNAPRAGPTEYPDHMMHRHPDFQVGPLGNSPIALYYFDGTAPNKKLIKNDVPPYPCGHGKQSFDTLMQRCAAWTCCCGKCRPCNCCCCKPGKPACCCGPKGPLPAS